MKTKIFYIKSILLAVFLMIESYFLSNILMGYVNSGNFFSPPREFIITTILMLLLILYTYFLTVGGWDKWEQYFIVALPIAAGITLRGIQENLTYGLITGLLILLILCYDIFLSTRLKNQMISFNPRLILKFSTRGVLFAFSLAAAIFVFMDKPRDTSTFNIGEKIGSITQKQFDKLIKPRLNESVKNSLPMEIPLEGDDYMSGLPGINLDLRQTVESEFNSIVEPYKRFIPPLIALVVFTFIRFLGGITNWLFTITVGAVFAFFKSVGFLHVNQKQVQKEEIGFESDNE